jgi:hypothetical protein
MYRMAIYLGAASVGVCIRRLYLITSSRADLPGHSRLGSLQTFS